LITPLTPVPSRRSRTIGALRLSRRKAVLGMVDVELITKKMLEQYTQQVTGETVASK